MYLKILQYLEDDCVSTRIGASETSGSLVPNEVSVFECRRLNFERIFCKNMDDFSEKARKYLGTDFEIITFHPKPGNSFEVFLVTIYYENNDIKKYVAFNSRLWIMNCNGKTIDSDNCSVVSA